MILAVDVGNSNTTVGLFNGTGELLFRALLETSRSKTRDQCAIELLGVFQLYGADACTVDGAILSSVVPPLTTIFIDAIARLTGTPPMVVGPGIRTGLNIKAEIHNQLGSDIVASSVAAIAKYPSPIVMVDMGTATSLSLIVGSVYEGCIIMPGLALAPILIGAALYGPKAGACLGGVFGAVVLLACILGWDPGGAILWNANPFLTALVCLGKGILAGLAAGLVYRAIAWGGKSHSSGRMLGGSIAAGIVSPVVNTGLFLLGLFFLFPTYLEAWATGAGQTVITYMIFTMVSINFVLELLINLVLSTVIVRVVSARSHS